MSPSKISFKVYQGSTFSEVLRWESSRKAYKTITGISNAAPCIVTSTAHGVPDGWRVKVTNVVGMTDINSTDTYHVATKLTADTIELNGINSVGYKVYTSGGILEYNTPIDLTGYTARMQIRGKIDDAGTIAELTTENSGITISTANSTITITISATATALYTFSTAVYSLELVSSGGVVTPFITGTMTLVKEVTR
jgi:hypothetical protein